MSSPIIFSCIVSLEHINVHTKIMGTRVRHNILVARAWFPATLRILHYSYSISSREEQGSLECPNKQQLNPPKSERSPLLLCFSNARTQEPVQPQTTIRNSSELPNQGVVTGRATAEPIVDTILPGLELLLDIEDINSPRPGERSEILRLGRKCEKHLNAYHLRKVNVLTLILYQAVIRNLFICFFKTDFFHL